MDTYMRYTARSPVLKVEKAFNIDFPVDHVEEARRTNIEADIKRVTVNPVTDPHHWKLDTHGFCILHAKSHLDLHEVFARRERVSWIRARETSRGGEVPQRTENQTRGECRHLVAFLTAMLTFYAGLGEQRYALAVC